MSTTCFQPYTVMIQWNRLSRVHQRTPASAQSADLHRLRAMPVLTCSWILDAPTATATLTEPLMRPTWVWLGRYA